ncbi:MAG: tRNA-intron lyase [Thermoplasmata archaeon]|nr:MAG: tRNA-intron lyase [Thermoplasmata archaeon]
MQTIGELIDNKKIIIKKTKYAGRLHSKNKLGKILPDNTLQLSLIEGAFLLDEKKIKLLQNNREIKLQDLIKIAAKKNIDFETKYLVFKDLKKRGYPIKPAEKQHISFYIQRQKKDNKKQILIAVFSERDNINIDKIKKLIQKTTQKNNTLWYAIVDEEGDITYYNLTLEKNLKGKIKEHTYPKTKGILLKNRVIIFDKKTAKLLAEKEFFGKNFGEGLQLSLVEAIHLLEKNIITIQNINNKKLSKKETKKYAETLQPDIKQRLTVFNDLKKHGLIVKTGFKFGTHFRAYTDHPNKTHADYLIHVVKKGHTSIFAEISRAVRLAHSVNKEIMFARVDENKIDYIKFGRLRP